jgi:peroxiredoxin
LHGTLPPEPVAAPEFAARNQLGEARGRPDLLGHPTVLWFFPASGTPG